MLLPLRALLPQEQALPPGVLGEGGAEALPAGAPALPEAGSERSAEALSAALGDAVPGALALWLAVAHQVVGALLVAATAWGAQRLGQRLG